MKTTRRNFLATAALSTAAASAALSTLGQAPSAARPPKARVKLGVSTYSYWHFRGPKVTVQTVIEKAAGLGIAGVDILHRQMDSEETGYLRQLKRQAFLQGVDLICLSIHQNFVMPHLSDRQKEIDHTLRCLRIAHELGIPCVRINSGRWNTVSFDRLMELRGDEPPIAGYKEDDAFGWCIECLEKCLPKAAEYGIMLAVENHWGLTRTPEGLLRIAKAINSPWFGLLMDTGNFLEDPYPKLEQIAAKTILVQAKTYYGGGEWYTLDLDYKRIASILAAVNYDGYVALEFEGKEDPNTAVPKSIAMFRESFGV